jgi:hypothetical protein
MNERRRRLMPLLACLCLAISGCYERKLQGDVTTFRYAPWMQAFVIVGGLSLVAAAWYLRKRWRKGALFCALMSPFVLFLIAPSMLTNYVLLDSEHFEAKYGPWWTDEVHSIQFKDCKEVRYIHVVEDGKSKGNAIKFIKHDDCDMIVPSGNLVRFTVGQTQATAQRAGVKVSRERDAVDLFFW